MDAKPQNMKPMPRRSFDEATAAEIPTTTRTYLGRYGPFSLALPHTRKPYRIFSRTFTEPLTKRGTEVILIKPSGDQLPSHKAHAAPSDGTPKTLVAILLFTLLLLLTWCLQLQGEGLGSRGFRV